LWRGLGPVEVGHSVNGVLIIALWLIDMGCAIAMCEVSVGKFFFHI